MVLISDKSSVKSASSGKMRGTGSGHSGFVSGDDGTVGMAHQVDVQVEGASVAVGSDCGNSGVGKVGSRGVGHVGSSMVAATGSKVVGTGGSNCGFVSGDDGAVGVAHQGSVQVEGATIAVGNNRSSVGKGGGSMGNSNRGNVATTSGKVVSTGSSNCRLINRNEGSVGMTNKGSVQVEGSRIAVGNDWSTVGNNWGSVGNGRNSSMGNDRGNTVCGSESTEVFSTGCGHCGLVHWNHCTVGVTHLSRDGLMAKMMMAMAMMMMMA